MNADINYKFQDSSVKSFHHLHDMEWHSIIILMKKIANPDLDKHCFQKSVYNFFKKLCVHLIIKFEYGIACCCNIFLSMTFVGISWVFCGSFVLFMFCVCVLIQV